MINKEFGNIVIPATPKIQVWCSPLPKTTEPPKGVDIWLVTRKQGQQDTQYTAFGDYASTAAEKRSDRSFSVGTLVDRLTMEGKLTEAGWNFVMANGVQRDADSLAKWTLTHTPKDIKYQGLESRQPA